MLPGFRFLFAAIVLSTSILVFGLGAAALLRAAHEEFASTPSWHTATETLFAQQSETTPPVLAMLRVEPPPADQKASENAAAPPEPAAVSPAPSQPEKIAVLRSGGPTLPEPPGPEAPVQAQNAAPAETAPPASAMGETKTATTEMVLSSPAMPAEQAGAPGSSDAGAASTKIAALGNAPVSVEPKPRARTASAKPDASALKKRAEARRAIQRRRIAQRAGVARQAPQQAADPFAQPLTGAAAVAPVRRAR
jgi:hypothetical protein